MNSPNQHFPPIPRQITKGRATHHNRHGAKLQRRHRSQHPAHRPPPALPPRLAPGHDDKQADESDEIHNHSKTHEEARGPPHAAKGISIARFALPLVGEVGAPSARRGPGRGGCAASLTQADAVVDSATELGGLAVGDPVRRHRRGDCHDRGYRVIGILSAAAVLR